MLSLGIPRTEIHKFADAQYWLRFFPQLWQEQLSGLGCAIDWRRSFITTDANPYYDSFVQWQMRRLKELGEDFIWKAILHIFTEGPSALSGSRSNRRGECSSPRIHRCQMQGETMVGKGTTNFIGKASQRCERVHGASDSSSRNNVRPNEPFCFAQNCLRHLPCLR